MKFSMIPHGAPHSFRGRITLVFTVMFLVMGSALLAATYSLVDHYLPVHAQRTVPSQQLIETCKSLLATSGNGPNKTASGSTSVTPSPSSFTNKCRAALDAASTKGSAEQRQRYLRELLWFSSLGLLVITVLAGIASWILSGRLLRPVRVITEAARRATDSTLGERLSLGAAPGELHELARTFNTMLERLEYAFAARQRFAANASHELRTPLAMMATAIDVARSNENPTTVETDLTLARVRRTIDDASRTIEALLTLAISDQGPLQRERIDLATVAEDALDVAAMRIESASFHLEASLQPAAVRGDAILLERMIANLIDNGLTHNNQERRLRLRTGTHGDRAFVEVTNTGPIVPAELIATLTEPFNRVEARRDPAGGVGLGLALVESIVLAHDATLEISANAEGGLTVEAFFRLDAVGELSPSQVSADDAS
jgi:signal transduction histidine kinase